MRRNPFCIALTRSGGGDKSAIEGGLCWDALSCERMKNPKSLEPYGYKVYSQNDEDGIIHEIFKRIGTSDKRFVEFGVQNGLESNCHLLFFYGWSGLWIEGAEEYCKEIAVKFKPVIADGKLIVKNAFITKENIDKLITDSGFEGDIDLLSIDIDGNDYYAWDAITSIHPRVVVIEYNGKFPPDLEWKQAYNPTHKWDGSDWHGASLKSLEMLGRQKGYRLVGTDLRGCNAFFVKEEIAADLFYEDSSAEALYNPLRLNMIFASPGHPAKYCLAKQEPYLGTLNYLNYELVEGFHAEEENGGRVFAWTSGVSARMRIKTNRNAKCIVIPYMLPEKVAECQPAVSFYSEISGRQSFKAVEASGTFDVNLSEASGDGIVEFEITTSYIWSPAQLLGTQDTRTLGICIVLSEIKCL